MDQSSSQPPVSPADVQNTQAQPTQQSVDPNAGKTLGIIGLVGAFILPLIGLILSIVAKRQSSKAGVSNGPALAGIIVGAIFTVIGLIVGVIMLIAFSALINKCQELGPGTHYENGTTYTCS